MAALLGLPEPPTAVFVESDEMAMGALDACKRMGVSVPGDVSVVGFDDHELSELMGITTVAQPVRDLGSMAAGPADRHPRWPAGRDPQGHRADQACRPRHDRSGARRPAGQPMSGASAAPEDRLPGRGHAGPASSQAAHRLSDALHPAYT